MSADPRDGAPPAPRGRRGIRGAQDVPVTPPALPTAAGLALGALADLALGDPRRGHPVAGFGTAAAALERRAWRDSRAAGAGYAAALTGAAVATGAALHRLTRGRPVARTAATAVVT